MRNYTRWRQDPADFSILHADILTDQVGIAVNTAAGTVEFNSYALTPDEARLYGVRLIEAAALADGERMIRAATT